jgi:hypothetical protein
VRRLGLDRGTRGKYYYRLFAVGQGWYPPEAVSVDFTEFGKYTPKKKRPGCTVQPAPGSTMNAPGSMVEFPGFRGDLKTMVSTILGDANVEPKERWEGPQDLSVH